MSKVYLVWQGQYSDRHVLGVFTVRADAEECLTRLDGGYIDESSLDEPIRIYKGCRISPQDTYAFRFEVVEDVLQLETVDRERVLDDPRPLTNYANVPVPLRDYQYGSVIVREWHGGKGVIRNSVEVVAANLKIAAKLAQDAYAFHKAMKENIT